MPPAAQPVAFVIALAVLSLLAGDEGDDRTAMALARRAAEVTEAQGLGLEPLCGSAYAALGRALARRGSRAEAARGRPLRCWGSTAWSPCVPTRCCCSPPCAGGPA